VKVDPGTADKTLLHNEVTLDYADANGNYYDQEFDFADVIVTAPVMSLSKGASIEEGTPGDPFSYTIIYENTGTGDAGNVTIKDTLPSDVTFISADPAPDSTPNNKLIWDLGVVPAGTYEIITVYVEITPGTWDQTVLHNVVTLDYSDANDNFIEKLEDSADVIVTAPVMTVEKTAGEVVEEAYITTNVTLRVTGEKYHDVTMTLYNNGDEVGFVQILRVPGNPDDQLATIENVTINLLTDSFSAVVVYTPLDDAINGQWWGDNPAWIILDTEYGSNVRIKHNFNVRHEDTWLWIVDDFRPYLTSLPLTLKYTVDYSIYYENIGTGDATDVWVYDELAPYSNIEESSPMYDTSIGNIVGWDIGFVPSGGSGSIDLVISFTYDSVIVKNWHPKGEILRNTALVEYHDTNGNLVEIASDVEEVTVFVPSELKEKKTPHYSAVHAGIATEMPSELMPFMGDMTQLSDKYLIIYAPTELIPKMMTSSELAIGNDLSTTDFSVVYIYIHPYSYESTPPPEEDDSEVEDIGVMLPVEIPPDIDIDFDNTVIFTITTAPTIEVIEPTIEFEVQPKAVYVVPQEATVIESETTETFTIQEVPYEVMVYEITNVEAESLVAVQEQEVIREHIRPVMISQPTIENSEITDTVILLLEDPDDTRITYLEPVEDTNDDEFVVKAGESDLETTVSDLRLFAFLILAINSLGVALLLWFQKRKWS
jgi:uncharacterized repeat protein (TIGR01451 family)